MSVENANSAPVEAGSMYDWIGGEAVVRALVDRFYDLMDSEGNDDEHIAKLRAMHQADLSPMRQSLFEYLSGWLGGPPLYIEKHGSPCLTGPHAKFEIDMAARDAWLQCMDTAILETGIDERYRLQLMPAFQSIANMLVNQT